MKTEKVMLGECALCEVNIECIYYDVTLNDGNEIRLCHICAEHLIEWGLIPPCGE